MTKQTMRFALFGNNHQTQKSCFIPQIIDLLQQRGADIFIESDFYHYIHETMQIQMDSTHVFDGIHFDADIAISVGGDGTFLKAASYVRDKQIPILGINTGRLGFMADASPYEIDTTIDILYKKEYVTEERSVIQVSKEGEAFQEYPFALNEVAILKRDRSSMISVNTYINNDYLTTYQTDGLILCTPTGSTGYSLSSGGPILVPCARNFVLTAVAPHSLNVRPIVLCDDVEITMTVESRSHNFLVAIDGRNETCEEGARLTLRRAPYTIQIIKGNNKRFFDTLRKKLMWGADQRS